MKDFSRSAGNRERMLMTVAPLGVVLLFGALIFSFGQEDQSKDILPAEAAVKTNPRRTQRARPVVLRAPRTFVPKPPPAGMEYAQLGITLWRIDSGNSKGIEQVGTEQTQERLDTNAAYQDGDTIRLNVISPTGGYLYIVDQEQYSDGSLSPAVLVFPTTTLRKGNNSIAAWESVQIPAYPSVWRFRPRRLKPGEAQKPQTAEVLTMIVSPRKLVDDARITGAQLELNQGEFENWQAQFKAAVRQFEMKGGAGQTVPARSKGVNQEGTEETTEEELDAQTTYQVTVKPGSPIMVAVPLRFNSAPVRSVSPPPPPPPPIKPPTE
jgi:hypothetical protein